MGALENAKAMNPVDIIARIAAENLLEFGAMPFPVAKKWELIREEKDLQTNPIRVVAALNNADVDYALLALLKEYPDKIFTGMSIAKCAIEAEEMYLYLPQAESTLADQIAKTAASFGIEIKMGIVNTRESRGGAFHHIETMLALCEIFEEQYEPGVYVAVKKDNTISEIQKYPFGTKISNIVGETDAKAIAVGTKIYDTAALDMTIEADTPLANGIITLFGPKTCMIHETKEILLETRKQSCGKCTFCREGLIQLYTMLHEISEGQGKKEFVELMSEIGNAMTFSTPCSLGQTASDPVMCTLQYFASEYDDHIKKKKCEHNVCASFMSIYIDPHDCTGCEECADVCPKDAIEGKKGYIHMIDEFECDKCGKCIGVCDEDAIIQTTGRVPKLPNRLMKVGKFKK